MHLLTPLVVLAYAVITTVLANSPRWDLALALVLGSAVTGFISQLIAGIQK